MRPKAALKRGRRFDRNGRRSDRAARLEIGARPALRSTFASEQQATTLECDWPSSGHLQNLLGCALTLLRRGFPHLCTR
jgi:hypothetical protein